MAGAPPALAPEFARERPRVSDREGAPRGPVAFVLKGYPRLSETFIGQEIRALERRGLDIRIVSLRHPTDRAIHPVHREIDADPRSSRAACPLGDDVASAPTVAHCERAPLDRKVFTHAGLSVGLHDHALPDPRREPLWRRPRRMGRTLPRDPDRPGRQLLGPPAE